MRKWLHWHNNHFLEFHLINNKIFLGLCNGQIPGKYSQVPIVVKQNSPKYQLSQIVLGKACENNRFSSLLASKDVSRGGTSATQRQKFHTDDVKSVQNLIIIADQTTDQLQCFSYFFMNDRKKATKVKCKRDESIAKQSIFVEYIPLQKKQLSLAGAPSQINTTLYQHRPGET